MDTGVLGIGIAALLGAVVSALMGWLDSKEPFDARKFGKSCVAGLIAAVGLAAAYTSGAVGSSDVLVAFLSGAGVDAVGNRIVGSLRGTP